MRALLFTVVVGSAIAGCGGTADPCDGQAASCITLTIQSQTVTAVDALEVSAFGEVRTSTNPRTSLPVRLALMPPATAPSGSQSVTVVASLNGSVVGSGQTSVQIGSGHTVAIIELVSGPTGDGGTSDAHDAAGQMDATPPVQPDMASCGDITSDTHNCGSCGHDCTALPNIGNPSGVSCMNSSCVVTPSACRSGFAHCSTNPNDGCEADLSQADHCGSCNACPGATPLCAASGTNYSCTVNCVSPMPDRCGMSCVDLQSSPSNCKTCGNACSYANAGATCNQGSCVIGSCTPGYADCKNGPIDGCETYIKGSDINNCGACNAPCAVGQICSSGSCIENQVTCASPGISCAQGGCFQAGRYSISAGGGIVVDLTNARRMWTRVERKPATYNAAMTDCATLLLEGIGAWTLPTYAEEVTLQYMTGGLMGCPVCNPAIDQAAFPMASDDTHWTTTYVANDCGFDTPNFCDGRNNYYTPTTQAIPYFCVHP